MDVRHVYCGSAWTAHGVGGIRRQCDNCSLVTFNGRIVYWSDGSRRGSLPGWDRDQIGRASCRERVIGWVSTNALMKHKLGCCGSTASEGKCSGIGSCLTCRGIYQSAAYGRPV